MKNRTEAFLVDEDKKNARSAWARMGVLMALLLTAGVLLWQSVPENIRSWPI